MSSGLIKDRKALRLLAAAMVLLFWAPGLHAQTAGGDADKLRACEAALKKGDPAAARSFLADSAFESRLQRSDPGKAAELTAEARALVDLQDLLAGPWRSDQEAALSQALALRIDFNTPLVKSGIGPAPESLQAWMAAYGKYTESRMMLVKEAIRPFASVSELFDADEAPSEQQWTAYTLRERNAVLAQKASMKLDRLVNNEVRTGADFQANVRSEKIFEYLDPAGRARYERYLTQLSAAESAKAGLPEDKLAALRDQPIEQQMYLLGGMYDGSKDKGGVSLERRIDGGRQSAPGETLSYQNNRLLADMLRSALPGQLKGTESGDQVLSFFGQAGGPSLAIESCQGCYAKYDPSSGRIILDSDLIQQYLRVKNLKTEELLLSKTGIRDLAEYVSPMIVHEAFHQIQHSRTSSAGVYDPYVQEDEIGANTGEAKYTLEKLGKDEDFRSLFSGMRSVSTYADQRLKLAQRYNRSPDDFPEVVRRQYYYGLPSYDAASADILSAVSGELERRIALSPAELKETEDAGITASETMNMTVSEITSSVGEMKTEALLKLRSDLLNGCGGPSGCEKGSPAGKSGAARSRVPAL